MTADYEKAVMDWENLSQVMIDAAGALAQSLIHESPEEQVVANITQLVVATHACRVAHRTLKLHYVEAQGAVS